MADAAIIPFPRAGGTPRPRTYTASDLAMLASYFERLAAISEADAARGEDRFQLGEAAAFRRAATTIDAVLSMGGRDG